MTQHSDWAWHVHHEGTCPLEWCYDYEGRVAIIEREKPERERKLRLRLFQMVKGKLPAALDQAGAAFAQAGAAYDQAGAAFGRVGAVFDQALAAFDQALAALDQARAVLAQARAALDQTRAAYDQALLDNMPAILALHAIECPECPWDGNTIFPQEKARK